MFKPNFEGKLKKHTLTRFFKMVISSSVSFPTLNVLKWPPEDDQIVFFNFKYYFGHLGLAGLQ